MTLIRRPTSRPSDSQVDQALRDLLEPTDSPSFRTGFDRRLARAVATDLENERHSRTMRRILWPYWIGAAVVSIAILWQLQERLMSGPGLWLSIGGLVTFIGAGLSLSILAVLPLKLGRLLRSLGR